MILANEEYPTSPDSVHFVAFILICLCNDTAPRRRCTCTRKRCRRWSTQSPRPRLTNSSHGLPRRLPIATSARVFFGVSPDKGCGVRSAVSSATKSARTCWTRIACKVSNLFYIYIYKYILIFLIDRSWIPCLLNFDTRFYSKWGGKNGRFVFTKCVKFLYVNIIYKKIEGIYVINCVGNECIWILQSWSYISYMFYNLLKYL